jgi:hypothetical protein
MTQSKTNNQEQDAENSKFSEPQKGNAKGKNRRGHNRMYDPSQGVATELPYDRRQKVAQNTAKLGDKYSSSQDSPAQLNLRGLV